MLDPPIIDQKSNKCHHDAKEKKGTYITQPVYWIGQTSKGNYFFYLRVLFIFEGRDAAGKACPWLWIDLPGHSEKY